MNSFHNITPIELIPSDVRLATFPIGRRDLWKFYKLAQSCFWVPEDVDLSKDCADYDSHPKMTDGIRRSIDYILAFFSNLDKMVNINITERFKKDFSIYEIDCFYDLQLAMENIHGELYSLQLETLIRDPIKKAHLLNSVSTIPVIKKMSDWINLCVSSSASSGERLIRMVCVEGLFFMSSFCIIYWLADRGLMRGLS